MTEIGKVLMGYAISKHTDQFIPREDDWEGTVITIENDDVDTPSPQVESKPTDCNPACAVNDNQSKVNQEVMCRTDAICDAL